ncbi:MAG: UDP-N-acetylmuramoyl-L-alanine--D-glutamate ligase [Candidatus Limnocylindria bacterium]
MTAASAPIHSVADLRGRRVVVLGLARSGVAAVRFLADAEAVVVAYDRRPATELAESVTALGARPVHLALGVPEAEARALMTHADVIVTSPSVSPRFPTTDAWLRRALLEAEGRGAELISEVELFLRLTQARVLAVTGTKGKTTTASLAAAILAESEVPHVLGGNIGRPLIEEAASLGPDEWAVLELSELQLPTISRGAELALYTNVGADHLDRHGSVEAYRAVKARLAELTAPSGRVVLNHDDAGCRELGERLRPESLAWYGLARPGRGETEAWIDEDGWLVLAGTRLLPAAEVPLPGRHMLGNVLCAALGALLADVPPGDTAAAIRAFPGVPHRLETVGERDGVRFVNDSMATIPAAAIAAIEAFDSPVVVIAGGSDKGLDYGELAGVVASRCRAAVLIGETAAQLERLLAGRIDVERAASMKEAVELAAGLAQPGDVVLLAPAAASFDMFTDYAARGDAFRAAVIALPNSRDDR